MTTCIVDRRPHPFAARSKQASAALIYFGGVLAVRVGASPPGSFAPYNDLEAPARYCLLPRLAERANFTNESILLDDPGTSQLWARPALQQPASTGVVGLAQVRTDTSPPAGTGALREVPKCQNDL